MPWEHRNGHGRYYTRSHKVNGEVIREYIGAGPLAEQVASADVATRQALTALRETERRQRAEARDLERQLDDLCGATDYLITIALNAAGYHQHARGPWRKSRVPTTSKASATPTAEPATTGARSFHPTAQRHIHNRHPLSGG